MDKKRVVSEDKANLIFGVIVALFGAAIWAVILGQNYKIWNKEAPGPGFMPSIAATGIIICGVAMVAAICLKKKKETDGTAGIITIPDAELFNLVFVTGMSLLAVMLSSLLGYIPCVTIAMILFAKFSGHCSWKQSIAVGVAAGIVMFIVFSMLLKVHFPRGIFGI
jgi:hypothetical protein